MYAVTITLIIISCIAAAFFGAYLATLSPDYGKPVMSRNMESPITVTPHVNSQQPSFSGFSNATH
jgi:hypothetical protein